MHWTPCRLKVAGCSNHLLVQLLILRSLGGRVAGPSGPLWSILACPQDGAFTLRCDTHPSTLCLNWQPSGSSSGGGSGSAAAVLDDYAARERWAG